MPVLFQGAAVPGGRQHGGKVKGECAWTRICYFEQGKMVQKVTAQEFGRVFNVRIAEAPEIRHWLTFDSAGYEFIQHADHVEVIRTDKIFSALRPRWYWHWFESQCIQLEHRYVMTSMKTKAGSR